MQLLFSRNSREHKHIHPDESVQELAKAGEIFSVSIFTNRLK